MTLDDLRAELNAMRTDDTWKAGWRARGIDPANVLSTLHGIFRIAARDWEKGDMPTFTFHANFALAYARGEHVSERPPFAYRGPRGPGMLIGPRGEDPQDEDEQRAEWVAYIKAANKEQTYSQAIAFFQKRFGYWPKRAWPGMPLYELDRGARIKHVRPGNVVPFEAEAPIPE